jgi:hypothetical protein
MCYCYARDNAIKPLLGWSAVSNHTLKAVMS